MATNTPTVPAMPITATTRGGPTLAGAAQVVGDRDGHAQILRSASTTLRRMAASAGSRPASEARCEGQRGARGHGAARQIERDQPRVRSEIHRRAGQAEADRPADEAISSRLGQHQAEDEAVGVADGLQHRQLARALADGDGHRVAGDQQQREEDDRADRQHQELDVAHLLHVAGGEGRLGLGARLVGRVARTPRRSPWPTRGRRRPGSPGGPGRSRRCRGSTTAPFSWM